MKKLITILALMSIMGVFMVGCSGAEEDAGTTGDATGTTGTTGDTTANDPATTDPTATGMEATDPAAGATDPAAGATDPAATDAPKTDGAATTGG